MRWLAVSIVVALLCAGPTTARAIADRDRPNDEIAAVTALAKLAVRRHDGARPHGTVSLDPIALVSADPAHAPPRACLEIVHGSAAARWLATPDSFRARGPPLD